MPEAERKKKIRASRDFISKNDLNLWLNSIMEELASLVNMEAYAVK